MKYPKRYIYGLLKFYADALPHRYMDQHQLFYLRYSRDIKKDKVNIIELTRYFVHNGWLEGTEEDFYKTYFPFRSFEITRKGDEYYRLLSIEYGGNFRYYKYFDRQKEKEWKKK